MSSKDTEFLKKRITQSAQPKEATTTTSSVTAVDETSQFLEDVTADSPDVQSVVQKKLHKRALLADAHDPQKAARLKEQQEQDDAQKELDEQERTQAEAIRSVTTRTISGVSDQTGAIADKVGTFPTYGGIGMLLMILIILLFTVVRVNEQGDTRLKQLWYMLNGRATIKGRQTVEAVIPGTGGNTTVPGGGVSGNFGTTPTSTPTTSTTVPSHSSTDLGF
jgi:Fe2+ transport system protein B